MPDPSHEKIQKLLNTTEDEIALKKKKKPHQHTMLVTVISLILLILILTGVYFWIKKVPPENDSSVVQGAEETPSPITLSDHSSEEVESISIQLAGEESYTVCISEAADETTPKYTIENHPAFSLDQSSASVMNRYAANLNALRMVEENAEDLSVYGLSDPNVIVSIVFSDKTVQTWLYGNKMPTSTQYYVCEEGNNTVYLVSQGPYNAFHNSLNELYQIPDPFLASVDYASYLYIEQAGNETIEIRSLDSSELSTNLSVSSLQLIQPFVYEAHADRVPVAFESALSVTLDSYAGEVEELPDCGLSDPEHCAAHVLVRDSDGNETEYWVGNFADDSSRYLRIKDSKAVFLTSAASLEYLQRMVPSYLVSPFSNLINVQRIDSVTVTDTSGSRSYKISISRQQDVSSGEEQATYDINGVPLSDRQFKSLYQEIIGLMNSQMCPDPGLNGEPMITLDFELLNSNSHYIIQFIEYDDTYYAVLRDNATLFLIKQSTLQTMLTKLELATGSISE